MKRVTFLFQKSGFIVVILIAIQMINKRPLLERIKIRNSKSRRVSTQFHGINNLKANKGMDENLEDRHMGELTEYLKNSIALKKMTVCFQLCHYFCIVYSFIH